MMNLIEAAKMAENLTQSRREPLALIQKTILLVIRSDGIVVNGTFTSEGLEMTKVAHGHLVSWEQLQDGNTAPLIEAIELVNYHITEGWKAEHQEQLDRLQERKGEA